MRIVDRLTCCPHSGPDEVGVFPLKAEDVPAPYTGPGPKGFSALCRHQLAGLADGFDEIHRGLVPDRAVGSFGVVVVSAYGGGAQRRFSGAIETLSR